MKRSFICTSMLFLTAIFTLLFFLAACQAPAEDDPVLGSTKVITVFGFTSPAAAGVIDEGAHTIAVTVPFGTNVTALVPTITHNGASISPPSGVAQNFTNPVVYTVTAADGTAQTYIVTVTVDAQPITAVDLAGTWLKTFTAPYTYTEGHQADAMLVEFSGNSYTMIFYYQTVQDGGNKGTFTVSGGNLVLSPTHAWNPDSFWVAETTGMTIPIILNGNVLTLTAIPLAKTEFSRPAHFIGFWSYANLFSYEMEFGEFTWSYLIDDGDVETGSGVQWGVSGTVSGFLRAVEDTIDGETTINGAAVYRESLTPYSFNENDPGDPDDDDLILTFPEGSETIDAEFTRTTTPS